jgi:ssDNA-binding replication factor A large subunit
VRDESSHTGFTPINAITPYSNKLVAIKCYIGSTVLIASFCRWTIKGRVTKKTEKKRWSNSKGDGTLFSIDITDQSSTIR